MSLNIAAPPIPLTTILSPLILTSFRVLSAVCVSSLISSPVRNITIISFFLYQKIYVKLFSLLLFLFRVKHANSGITTS